MGVTPTPDNELATLRWLIAERDAELAVLRARSEASEAEVEKLRLLIKQLQRAMYGRRSEKIDPDQLQLGLEDIEQSIAMAEAASEAAAAKPPEGECRAATVRRNRGNLPKHLPREEIVIAPESTACPCCGGAMHVIGEDASEQLDVIPALRQRNEDSNGGLRCDPDRSTGADRTVMPRNCHRA